MTAKHSMCKKVKLSQMQNATTVVKCQRQYKLKWLVYSNSNGLEESLLFATDFYHS